MLKKTVLTFAFLTILTTFYGFNAHFGTPVTDDVLNRMAEADHAPLVEEKCVISAYDNLIRLADDPDVLAPLRFLREREIVHYQRFGEALRAVAESMGGPNYYAINPAFDL